MVCRRQRRNENDDAAKNESEGTSSGSPLDVLLNLRPDRKRESAHSPLSLQRRLLHSLKITDTDGESIVEILNLLLKGILLLLCLALALVHVDLNIVLHCSCIFSHLLT
jgi:hypothetical protein